MNIYDAIKVLGIELLEISAEDVKSYYRKASKKYHPDHNASGEEMMKLVNEAHSVLQNADFPITVSEGEIYDYGQEINRALNTIVDIQGLNIEVCGSWVWVSGETKPHKDTLGTAKFIYSGKKKMWYFRPKSQKRRWRGNNQLSIDEIRSKYGSEKVKNRKPYALQAHA